ncbi:MAG: GNAT family N-acetyltransferase [Ferruginibacter sp.]|nr:GNAT family N-acetyltransferase [Ferruginibacter sp.]
MISVIAFESKYADDFKQLNLEWLNRFGLTEAADLKMLNNPQKEIIDTGGCIFLAKSGGNIVGSAALIKETFSQYELAKMSVAEAFRGKGISKLLIEACLERARKAGAERIYLSSNSQLTTALNLYEKYGFKYISVKDSHYTTADVMMELAITGLANESATVLSQG